MDKDVITLWLSQQTLFKSQDLKAFINSERMTYIYLKRWIKEDLVRKLPYQYYSPVHPQTKQVMIDPMIFCNHIVEDGYVVGLKACYLHDLPVTDPAVITIGSKKTFRKETFEGITYKSRLDVHPVKKTIKEGVFVTDYVDTVLETIRDLDKLMALQTFVNVLKAVDVLETDDLIQYLDLHNKNIMYQKCGFLVDANLLRVDNRELFISHCHARIGKSQRSLSRQSAKQERYVKEWQLVVPNLLLS